MNEVKFLDVKGEKIPALFDLNVVAELQEKYGSLSEWNAKCFPEGSEPRLKPLIHAFELSINEGYDAIGSDKRVTNAEAGRIVTAMTIDKAAARIKQLVVDSTKSGDGEKNAPSPTTENQPDSISNG